MRLALIQAFTLLILFCSIPAAAQSGHLFAQTYSPSISRGSIQEYLDDLQTKTHIPVSYSAAYTDLQQTVSLPLKTYTVATALQELFRGQALIFRESNDKILILPADKESSRHNSSLITVNGYVKERDNKEVMIGAVLYVSELGISATTNSFGFYSLSLPADKKYRVLCGSAGYVTDTFFSDGQLQGRHDILLAAENTTLAEVNIIAEKELPIQQKLSYEDIKDRPAVLGENDVMRALQHVAGVQSGTDGTNSVIVRGGDPGQNLSLLDGIPLYYIDHFMGFTSVYNPEAVRSVDFYKGAFPSRFGGRLSSVIDVHTKDGNMEHWGGQFSMGMLKGSLNVEGPLIKNKASIMLSGRRTWPDLLWMPFTRDLALNFYDLNVKANYIWNKNNRLYLSFYNGRDRIGIDVDLGGAKAGWGNTLGSVRLNSIVNPKLFVNTTLIYSRFLYTLSERRQEISPNGIVYGALYKGRSSIDDIALRLDANWYASTRHKIEFGTHYSIADFIPAELSSEGPYNSGYALISPTSRFKVQQLVVFAEDEFKPNRRWTIKPGLHMATWFNAQFTHSSLQPRLYIAYRPASRHTIYTSYTQMAQFLHLINNNTFGLPTDFWLPSAERIRPEKSQLLSLGYSGRDSRGLSWSMEGYYKDIRNTVTYNVGKNLFDNSLPWDQKIVQGNGWSYGAEFSAGKKWRHFTWAASYTLSWSWRQFAQLNAGDAFPYRFDRRHNIRTTLRYEPSTRFNITASWVYMTGEAITLPDQIYPDLDNNLKIWPGTYTGSNNYTYNLSGWNNYRLPPIHRLDIGMNFTKKKGRRLERTWSAGLFNAYGHRNISYVDLVSTTMPDGSPEFRLRGLSVLQFVPYLSYQLRF
jgi:hypothetical protein